jgi:hypothetical protein
MLHLEFIDVPIVSLFGSLHLFFKSSQFQTKLFSFLVGFYCTTMSAMLIVIFFYQQFFEKSYFVLELVCFNLALSILIL